MGRPELFQYKKTKPLEFSDVFPLVYLKIHVDEMQDYTPVQYNPPILTFKSKETELFQKIKKFVP